MIARLVSYLKNRLVDNKNDTYNYTPLFMKNFLLALLFLVFSFSHVLAQLPDKKEKPNVLVILTDDQGYYDVAACGASDLVTPSMDNLFDDGMKFNNFYANCLFVHQQEHH